MVCTESNYQINLSWMKQRTNLYQEFLREIWFTKIREYIILHKQWVRVSIVNSGTEWELNPKRCANACVCVCACVWEAQLLKQPLHKSSQRWEGERGSWWESLDSGGGQSPLCPSLLSHCWVWQPAGQLARRPITEFPLISWHDRTRDAGREWESLKSDCPWESRMKRSERRGKQESKDRHTANKRGEKLLPAA